MSATAALWLEARQMERVETIPDLLNAYAAERTAALSAQVARLRAALSEITVCDTVIDPTTSYGDSDGEKHAEACRRCALLADATGQQAEAEWRALVELQNAVGRLRREYTVPAAAFPASIVRARWRRHTDPAIIGVLDAHAALEAARR